MQVYIKNRKRRKDEFQFFMHDFVDACKESGFKAVPDIFPSYKFHIRSVLRTLLVVIYKMLKKTGVGQTKKKAIVVTSSGGTIIDNSFPYFLNREIIPVIWDNWPPSFHVFLHDLKFLNIKTIIVSVKSHAEYIKKNLGINAYWMPEGISSSLYVKGEELKCRPYDIFEMGRQMPAYHEVLQKLDADGRLSGYLTSNSKSKKCSWLPFEQLLEEMSKYKIMICFPRCDTNPRAKGVETLTQRYWEAMLSRCLIVGRAPSELVELCGYNPVVDVNWQNPEEQMNGILSNIEGYQDLVNKNYEFANKNADWKWRMLLVKEFLISNGYQV